MTRSALVSEERREIATRVSRVVLEPDGVTRVIILPDREIDAEDIRDVWRAQETLCGSRPRYSYVDIRDAKSSTPEARSLLRDSPPNRRALAVVVGSSMSRLLGSFFIGLARPSYPTRLFTDEAKAMAWLRAEKARQEG
jgi:hypothetical protein